MKTQLFVTALALAASTSAFAGENIKIDKVELLGKDCSLQNASTTIDSTSPTDEPNNIVKLNFAAMEAEIPAGETGRVTKVCKTLVTVTIPAGYTIGDAKLNNKGFAVVPNTSTTVRFVTKLLAGQVNYIDPVRRSRFVTKNQARTDFEFNDINTFDAVGDIYDGACDQERTVELEVVSRIVLAQSAPAQEKAIAKIEDFTLEFPLVNGNTAVKCQEYNPWSWDSDLSWGRDSEDEVLGNIKPSY